MGKYLAAEHEQCKHKTVGQKRQLCHHRKFCCKQVLRRYRACHDQVPVVPQMFLLRGLLGALAVIAAQLVLAMVIRSFAVPIFLGLLGGITGIFISCIRE